MSENNSEMIGAGMGIVAILVTLCFILAIYVFACFCFKKICEKCGVTPGALIWIPIVNLVPLLQVAKMPVWMIILFFIPVVGFIVGIIMWAKICAARGKNQLLVIGVFLLPIVFVPYLAFAD